MFKTSTSVCAHEISPGVILNAEENVRISSQLSHDDPSRTIRPQSSNTLNILVRWPRRHADSLPRGEPLCYSHPVPANGDDLGGRTTRGKRMGHESQEDPLSSSSMPSSESFSIQGPAEINMGMNKAVHSLE